MGVGIEVDPIALGHVDLVDEGAPPTAEVEHCLRALDIALEPRIDEDSPDHKAGGVLGLEPPSDTAPEGARPLRSGLLSQLVIGLSAAS